MTPSVNKVRTQTALSPRLTIALAALFILIGVLIIVSLVRKVSHSPAGDGTHELPPPLTAADLTSLNVRTSDDTPVHQFSEAELQQMDTRQR